MTVVWDRPARSLPGLLDGAKILSLRPPDTLSLCLPRFVNLR